MPDNYTCPVVGKALLCRRFRSRDTAIWEVCSGRGGGSGVSARPFPESTRLPGPLSLDSSHLSYEWARVHVTNST